MGDSKEPEAEKWARMDQAKADAYAQEVQQGDRRFIPQAPRKEASSAESCLAERAMGNGGCGACSICCGELRQKVESLEAGAAPMEGGDRG